MFKKHLAIESLEKRMMLDGNVVGVMGGLNGDVLELTGDFRDNAIWISSGPAPKTVIVQTMDVAAGHDVLWSNMTGGTLSPNLQTTGIDKGGVVANVHLFTGVKSVDLKMKNGDDVVGIASTDYLAGVPNPASVGIRKHIFGNMGNGDDQFGMHSAMIFGKLKLKTLGHNDFVDLDTVMIARRAVFKLGWGHDFLHINQTQVGGDMKVIGGGGDDIVVAASVQVVGSVFADIGLGDDQVFLDQTQFADSTTLNTGDGEDKVYVYSSSLGGAAAGGFINVDLGNQNDYMEILNSQFLSQVTVDGGPGVDNLVDLGGNFFAMPPNILNIP